MKAMTPPRKRWKEGRMTDTIGAKVVTTRKNPYDITKLPDEQRIVSVDVAMRAGSTNDNTIITRKFKIFFQVSFTLLA